MKCHEKLCEFTSMVGRTLEFHMDSPLEMSPSLVLIKVGSTITSLKIFDYRLRLTWAISTTNRPNRRTRIDWGDLNRFRPLQCKNAQSVQIDLVSWSKPP